MAEHTLEIGNMERNEELFEEKMGFPRDAEGLELTDEQLVNFLLLCHQTMMLPHEDEEVEEEEHDGDMKVKIIKMDSGNAHEMMNSILGPMGPKVM